MWVDLRKGIDTNGLDRVQWGIVGKKPNEKSKKAGSNGGSPPIPTNRFPSAMAAFYTIILIVISLLAWLYIPPFFAEKPTRPIDIGFESVLIQQAAKELCQRKADNSHSVELTGVAFVRNQEKNRFEVTLNSDSQDGYVEFQKSVEVEGCSNPIQVRTTFEGKVDVGELRANDKVEIVGRIASIKNNGDYYVVIQISECVFKRLVQ
jgi:hypothetical protein